MVRKTRIKYLIITLLGLAFFFLSVFGVVSNILKKGAEHEIVNKLTELENSVDPDYTTLPHDYFVCQVKTTNGNETEYEITTKEVFGFTQEEIDSLVDIALSKNYPLGSKGYIYYKISFVSDGQDNIPQKIVAADFSFVLDSYKENVNTTLLIVLVILVVIGILSWLFSFWLFKPIEETLFKQKQFISDVSHELKTPVAIISANADVIKNTNDSEYVENIKSQSERMGLLVNDLLTLSSLDEGTTEIKKVVFSASELTLKALLPFDALAFEKGKFLKFEVEENLFVKGVEGDLVKISEILIDNAVKYATKGTEIVINLKREGKKIKLSVLNKGCNVSSQDKERIFERFYRADASRSREKGGSGLGLSIAKSLSQRNGWTIVAFPKLEESMEIVLTMKEAKREQN